MKRYVSSRWRSRAFITSWSRWRTSSSQVDKNMSTHDACNHIDLSNSSTFYNIHFCTLFWVLQLMQQTFNLCTLNLFWNLWILSFNIFYGWFWHEISGWVQHYPQTADSWDDPGGWRISTGCHSGIQQTAWTKPVRPLIAKFMALFEARGKITFSSSPRQGSLRLERDSREGSNRTPVIACRGWHL